MKNKEIVIDEFNLLLKELKDKEEIIIFAKLLNRVDLDRIIKSISFLINSVNNNLMIGNYKNAYIKVISLKKILSIINNFSDQILNEIEKVLFNEK